MVGLEAMETTIEGAEIGHSIREARTAAQLGVRQLAKAAGMPVRRLRALETGDGSVSHGEVAAVAAACGVDPATLLASDSELVVVLTNASQQMEDGTVRGEQAVEVVL